MRSTRVDRVARPAIAVSPLLLVGLALFVRGHRKAVLLMVATAAVVWLVGVAWPRSVDGLARLADASIRRAGGFAPGVPAAERRRLLVVIFPAAAPFAVFAVLNAWRGDARFSPFFAAAAAAICVLGVAMPVWGERAANGLRVGIACVSRGVSHVIVAVGFAVLLVPPAAFLRLAGVDPVRLDRGPRWVDRSAPASRPWSIAGRSRIPWPRFLAVSALVVAVCVVLAYRASPEPTIVGIPYWSEAHPGEDFAKQLYREQAVSPYLRHSPVEGWRNVTYAGRLVHVDGMVRRTPIPADPAGTVWFLGGSTMFGVGQRDGYTIPAVFARRAAAAGLPVQAVNLGVDGFVAWQEAALMQQYADHHAPPDLIVLYDGANDQSLRCQQIDAGESLEAHAAIGNHSTSQLTCFRHVESSARRVGAAVSRDLGPIYAWAATHDVPVVHFWQPTASTRGPSDADAELARHLDGTPEAVRSGGDLSRAIRRSVRPEPVDLTAVFDEVHGPIFFDWVHTNERGAAIVASAMWQRVEAGLRASINGA